MSPLCERFLRADQLDEMEPFYPLHVRSATRACSSSCRSTCRPRRSSASTPTSRRSPTRWVEHARGYVDGHDRAARPRPRQSSSSRSPATTATCCSTSSRAGIPVLGIEPAANVAEVAERAGHPDAESSSSARELARAARRGGPGGGPGGRQQRLRPRARTSTTSPPACGCCWRRTGVLTLEFPHLLRLIEGNQFDTIYHEHFSYFTLLTARARPGRRTACASSTSRSCRPTAARCGSTPPRRRAARPSHRARSTRCAGARARPGFDDARAATPDSPSASQTTKRRPARAS